MVVFIQCRIRYLLFRKNQLNKKLDILYNLFNEIMANIQFLHLYDVITHTVYNLSMNAVNIIFTYFKKLPRPLRLHDFKEIKIYYLNDIIEKIKTDLISFTKKYGCINTKTIIFLNGNITPNTSINKTLNNLNVFYETNFKIKSYSIVYKTADQDNSKIIKDISRPKCKNNKKLKRTIIEEINGATLYYPVYRNETINYFIIADGFFIYDTINISRLGGYFERKNNKLDLAVKNININNNFKFGYILQLSQKEFVIYDINEIITRCISAYNEYNTLTDLPISELIKKFLKSGLKEKRDILTVFLLMKDNISAQYIAYMLYDIITNNSYSIKKKTAAQLLFNSLHWSVQRLLKTALKKSNNYTLDLANFKEDDISYEKRICLLKVDDSVKTKAMIKYKEISKNNDNSAKVKNYLEGLLRIPFGIYKKEGIIAFLQDYMIKIRNSLTNTKKTLLSLIDKISNSENALTQSTQLTQITHLDNILKLISSFERKKNLISSDINIFLSKIRVKIDVTLKKDTYKDINKTYFDYDYISKICKCLKVSGLKMIIKSINQSLLGPDQLSTRYKKTILVEKLSVFLSQTEHQHFIKKNSSLLGIDNRKTICQRYKISKNKKYKRFCYQVLSLGNEWDNYKSNCKTYLKDVKSCLDNAVYGQEEAKNQIEQIIAQWINGDMKGYCFGFEGPPGTGKTSLARNGIARCLVDDNKKERPFAFIALGGTSNGSTLEGHNYTYLGSTWGRIVDVLMEVKCMNPIIFIDELDKVSRTEHGREIIGILTHLTDLTQNSQFTDRYFSGINIDLSRVLFIFSYNDYSIIDPILADRIHRVKFKRLSKNDKFIIARDYILPELLSIVGFSKDTIVFTNEVLEYIVITYTYEAGVRKLKEKLFEIIRFVNLKYLRDDIEIPFRVSISLVDEIFTNKMKVNIKTIDPVSRVGRINGLYATASGLGGITIIEAFKTPSESKLSLELTGQQGNVMQESMKVARTVAWNLLPDVIKTSVWKDMKDTTPFGIHIHCPEGAVPKDGPSAGIAITIAIVSLLCNIKINNTIALTGEIDLDGNVHEIGGLDSKIDGAKQAGVKTVICPFKNKEDVDKIQDKSLLESVNIVYVKTIREVLKLALVKNNVVFIV